MSASRSGKLTANRHSSLRPPAAAKSRLQLSHQGDNFFAIGSTTSIGEPRDAAVSIDARHRSRPSSGNSLRMNAATTAQPPGNLNVFRSNAFADASRPNAAYVQRASAAAHGFRSTPTTRGAELISDAHAAPATPVPQPRSRRAGAGAFAAPNARTISRTNRK